MSDYRNDRGRDSEKHEPLWRPAYQGNHRRRRYVIKRPLYRQGIFWIIIAVCVVAISMLFISFFKWGIRDNPHKAIGGTVPPTPAASGALANPENESQSNPSASPNAAPSSTPTPAPAPSPSLTPTLDEGPLVWDTENGASFHFDEHCKGMRGAAQESMLVAYNRGLKPCERCVTSQQAIEARPKIKVKAVTSLPPELGNVVIQDPEVFDIFDVTTQLGNLALSGKPALMVRGVTTGGVSLLYSNQPNIYEIKVRAILTDDDNKIVWDMDGDPVSYTQSGLDMPREFALAKDISMESLKGLKLTILVYARDGFEGVDADIAVLGMYQNMLS